MAVTLVYLDDNPGQAATGGNKNGVCIGQQRRISVKATFDAVGDVPEGAAGTITSPYNIINVEGLPPQAVQAVTNSYLSGSVALTEVPEVLTDAGVVLPYYLTIVCSN